MKQQVILEKLKKSLPPEQSMDAENFAPSFCLPSKKPPNQNKVQQQLPQQSQGGKVSTQSESYWPKSGSSVRVRLDTATVITGVVTNDGSIADALRVTGFIGVQTSDGQLIEVPYPDKNVFVNKIQETTDLNNFTHLSSSVSSSSSSSSSSLSSSLSSSVRKIANENLESESNFDMRENMIRIENEKSSKITSSRKDVDGDIGMMSLSSWPTEENSSEWKERSRTLIGKRLSKCANRSSVEKMCSDDDGEISKSMKNYDDINCSNDDDDDDDDVQWVGGHETLTNMKKLKKKKVDDNGNGNSDGSDSDESDEEEVHWQTPSDSADIDIEVS